MRVWDVFGFDVVKLGGLSLVIVMVRFRPVGRERREEIVTFIVGFHEVFLFACVIVTQVVLRFWRS